MNEVWKDVENYEGIYQVSSHGNVRSVDRYVNARYVKRFVRGVELNQHKSQDGYLFVALSKDNKQKSHYVHRLVANAFICKPKDMYMVNHL